MDNVVFKCDVDVTAALANLTKVHDKIGEVEQFSVGQQRAQLFQGATASAQKFNEKLGEQIDLTRKLEAIEAGFRTELGKLENQQKELNARQKEFVSIAKYNELKTQLGQVNAKIKEMTGDLGKTESLWDKIKAKFSKGFSIPKVEVPTESDRDEKGRFKGGGSGSGSSGGKSKQGSDLFDKATSGLLGDLTGAAGLSLGAGAAVIKATTDWAKYGQKLAEVSAITGTTGKGLVYLDEQAQKLSKDSGIAGEEILDAFKNIGSIKPEILANSELLAQTTKEVVALSQAAQIDLTAAAQATLGSLNQFGEGADQAGRYVNVLAAGALAGASEINETADALQNSGTAMKAAGLSFEQGNALIQSLAGVMIKGGEAGTGLRNVLLKLETSADKNLRPSVVGLDAALANAAKKFNNTTELTKEFGAENIIAARRVIENREEIAKMTKEITGTSVAYDQARTQTDTLATDLKKAGNSITNFFKSLGESQDGFLRGVVQGFNEFLGQMTSKGSVFKAFWNGLFEYSGFKDGDPSKGFNEGGLSSSLLNAYNKASAQKQANEKARVQEAQNTGIKSAAEQSVADDTKALADLYVKQGQEVPAAQKAAINKVKEQRDAEYDQAVADHQRLKGEFEKANKDQRDAMSGRFDDSRKAVLAAKSARDKATSEAARQAKNDSERAAALASAAGEGPSDKEKNKAKKDKEDQNKLLLKASEDYLKEMAALEARYSKSRLERMDKDSEDYINEKAQLDKQEIDLERAKVEKLLQLAASNKTVINKQTGQREVTPNTSVTLEGNAPEVAQFFADEKKRIDEKAAKDRKALELKQAVELIELQTDSYQKELDLFDKQWEQKLQAEKAGTEKYLALVKKREHDRAELETDIKLRQARAVEEVGINNIDSKTKGYDQTQTQFDRQKELDKLAYQENSSSLQISALSDDPKNSPEIARLTAVIKAIKDKRREIELLGPVNRDVFDLLGISKSFKDESERQVFLNSLDAISNAIRSAADASVQASEARIAALDSEIQEKENQLKIEQDRDDNGYANNLKLRQQELADLKRQKTEEEAVKRKSQQVQSALDLATLLSSNAVSAANLFQAATEAAKQNSKLGPIVGIIAAVAGVATILGTLFAARAKIKAMSQMREGGRIPLSGRSHAQGGHRIEGTDIEIERGEHVTRASQSEKYDKTLESINRGDDYAALHHLLRESGIRLPALQERRNVLATPAKINVVNDMRKLEEKFDTLSSQMSDLIGHVSQIPKETVTFIGEGKVATSKGGKRRIEKL